MRVVLLGAPGCGKGTQSELLRQQYAVPTISTGDMLRAAMTAGSPLGEKARSYVMAGALVADEIILDLVEERLKQPDLADGFISDGFPRSIAQADGLQAGLTAKGIHLDRVVKIDVSKKTLLERLTSRRICPGCGALYNLITSPSLQDGVCDRCGTKLVQREDDMEATVRRRLNVYESSTAPLIDYYDARQLLSIINGEGTIPAVFERLKTALESANRPAGA